MNKEEEQKTFDDSFNDEDKIVSDFILWDYKNDTDILGYVISIDEEGRFGRSIQLETVNGNVTIPSLTALEHKLKDVTIGDKVKIVNKGEKKAEKTGRMYYDFDVFIQKN